MYAVQPNEPVAMTEAEYLAFEESSEIKHEFCQGYVYDMSGGSGNHGKISVNVSTQLSNQLFDTSCYVVSSDLRIHIASKQAYRYPDVSAFCEPLAYIEGRTDGATNPIMLVEVVSPSSAGRDYKDKLNEYTTIPTLQAYLLVEQDQPRLAHYIRHESGQ